MGRSCKGLLRCWGSSIAVLGFLYLRESANYIIIQTDGQVIKKQDGDNVEFVDYIPFEFNKTHLTKELVEEFNQNFEALIKINR